MVFFGLLYRANLYIETSWYIMSLNGRDIKSSHGESIPISLHRVNGMHPFRPHHETGDIMKLLSSNSATSPRLACGTGCKSSAVTSTFASITPTTTPTMHTIHSALFLISRLLLRLTSCIRCACVGAGTCLVNIPLLLSIPRMRFMRALYICLYSGTHAAQHSTPRAMRTISVLTPARLYIYSTLDSPTASTTESHRAQVLRYQNLTRFKPIPRGGIEPVGRPRTPTLNFPRPFVKNFTKVVQSRTAQLRAA